jgi:hypothetical protein
VAFLAGAFLSTYGYWCNNGLLCRRCRRVTASRMRAEAANANRGRLDWHDVVLAAARVGKSEVIYSKQYGSPAPETRRDKRRMLEECFLDSDIEADGFTYAWQQTDNDDDMMTIKINWSL